MTALVVDRRNAEITLAGQALVICAGTERMSVPCAHVERLIVRSPARIDTAVLARLWSQGAGVLILSGRRSEPTARFLGMPHKDSLRRIAQLRVQSPCAESLEIARTIVAAKLSAEEHTLETIADNRRGMGRGVTAWRDRAGGLRETLAGAGDLDTVRGVEGASAAAYFTALARAFPPALAFRARRRRPPPDPVNVCLSLGYTLLTFEASRQAQIAGLDPMLGTLHAPAWGRESLACDLMEPLRPRLDLMVFRCFAERRLRGEHFTADADGRCLMGKAGRQVFYAAVEDHMTVWSRWLRRAAWAFARALPEPSGHPQGDPHDDAAGLY